MTASVDLRLGIDVGGTNTDAVVIDGASRLLSKAKSATTEDVTAGIVAAIDAVLASGEVVAHRITHVMVGTTHATNAVVERRGLGRVGVVRIGAPAAEALPPLAGWPPDLRSAVGGAVAMVPGGLEFDGREIEALDEGALVCFFDSVAGNVDAIALTSVFAPVSDAHERRAEELARQRLGELPISLSSEIGAIGLVERENATVLNAALVGVAAGIAGALQCALSAREIRPVATYFTQNDGTLMALDYVLRHPVLTIGSGPANSMRGAAHLSGLTDALVADVGGTSTDVGVLINGFPRESTLPLGIGGVPTNFRMPDLVNIPLGGGTVVHGGDGGVRLGPKSVRHRLWQESLVFGGKTPTLTDAGVATGRLSLGERARTTPHMALLRAALRQAEEAVAEAVDRVKSDKRPQPLVVVGGAARLLPDHLPGVSEVLLPEHFEVANAVGAAIADVSGQVDMVAHPAVMTRSEALASARAAARSEAVQAGADPDRVEIVEVEEVPMAYLPDPAVRLRVKAAGPLALL